jgi:hypothetical protein
MKKQRSSGGEKFVRGLLVLPELRRPSRRDTPKITSTSNDGGCTPAEKIVDLETTVLHRALDTGLRPDPFTGRAASLLPGLLAATRTGLHTG